MKPYEKTIKVTEINLDQENPRFPPVNSQRDALYAMLDDQGDKLIKLALDIYQNGLNPSVKLIVFKDGKQFIDGDGNRRLTALKILETPSLADAFPKVRKGIETILKRPGEVPTEVGCVIFQDRASARHWISVNHGGEQEGRGQINWNAEQKNRFERKPSIGLEALDLLTHKNLITSDDKSQVNKSTLDRLLSYKEVKTDLSITKKGDHFKFGNVEDLRKVVLSLRGKAVDAVYTAERGKDFVQDVIASHSASPVETSQHPPLGSTDPRSGEPGRGNRSPRENMSVLPIFGGKLSLRKGHVNNLYRDLESLYSYFCANRTQLSTDFVAIVRMSLRLLTETAASDMKKARIDDYVADYFDQAKRSLDRNTKTYLSSHSVDKNTIIKLLHTGAHKYSSSNNEEQTLAISVVLGAMLSISHGKRP